MEPNASNRNPDLGTKVGLLLGGALLGAVFTLIAVLPSLQRQIQSQTETIFRHLQTIQEKDQRIDALKKQLNDAAHLVNSQRAQLAALELPEAETSAYTLLYEFRAGASGPASPLELLNLVKPGLGSALASMQTQQQLQQIQVPGQHPTWLIPGYVKPIFNGQNTTARYVWLDTESGKRDVFAPRGTIVQ